jgi:hypothetical protein
VLPVHVGHSHAERGADPAEGEDEQADQRAVAETYDSRAVDTVEELAGSHVRSAAQHRQRIWSTPFGAWLDFRRINVG